VPKKAHITQERVEYNVFLFDEPPKGSKWLKIFKISLTFRFDKLSNSSKSVHTRENFQILTVSNKKNNLQILDFFQLKLLGHAKNSICTSGVNDCTVPRVKIMHFTPSAHNLPLRCLTNGIYRLS
jgi:hypothetical protein